MSAGGDTLGSDDGLGCRMAIYHFHAKVIQRSQGRSVVAAAAYRAAEALLDEKLGRTFNYLDKPGVVYSEILLPVGAAPRWRDRETLWNEVERVERRHDAVLAREIEIALPRELGQAGAIALARDYVREQFVARGMVADLNVHWGVAADGGAQPHAHVLLTMRRIGTTSEQGGLDDGRRDGAIDARGGARRAPDVAGHPRADARAGGRSDRGDPRDAASDRDPAAGDDAAAGEHRAQVGGQDGAGRIARLIAAARLRLGLRRRALQLDEHATFGLKERAWNDRALLRTWRQRWAEMANARLAEAGFDARIDHRSYAEQGIVLEPQNKIGPAGARRAARGEDAERADEHRAIARRNGERLLAEPRLALDALTRQQSTFTRQDLARLVSRQSDGDQFAAIMAKVEASPDLVRVGKDGRDRMRFSTREMVGIEQEMMRAAISLNRRTTHRVGDKRRLAAVNGSRAQLSEEQALAYLHVTRSRDLAVIVGIAGGGKSTMLGAARQTWQGQGYRVRGAALSGIAAEGLEGSAGIESRTIASWEYAWAAGKELLTACDVLVVDEAGMIGSRQLGRVLERARTAGAKVVLVGDAEQLQAIEAGAAFRAIADQVGVIAITEPRRQLEAWQREATKELATARTVMALDRYEAAGMVHRHETREAARDGVIAAWNAARQQSPLSSHIILAHERVDVRALNEAARAVRRDAGELGADHHVQTEAGERLLAEGDRIYFLRNERGLGVKNGTLGTLARIEGGQLTVRLDGAGGAGTGRAVAFELADYADIDHGYAATVHKTQGVTVDQAHVLATPGMDRHLAYVALSRHRHAARLHWAADQFDTPARLRDRLGRERAKDTTLDYDEADPVAAYAEWRGLNPLVPPSEIVVRREPVREPAGEHYREKADLSVLEGLEPSLGRRRPRDHVIDPPPIDPRPRPAPPTPVSVPTPTAHPSGRPTSATRRRVTRQAPIAARSVPEPLPWAGLDPTPPASPLLRAARYEPISAVQAHAAVQAAVGRERRRLERRYEEVYRNPQAASARYTLLSAELGAEAAEDRIARDPGILGPLRGGWLTAGGRKNRAQALRAGGEIVDHEQNLRRAEQEAWHSQRAADEKRREQAAIEVPGLSPKAQAAVRALADAEVRPDWSPPELSKDRNPTPERIVAMTKCARLYQAILADGPLLAELNRFEEAAGGRLASVGPVGSTRSHMPDAKEREAGRLLSVLAAARALHAWSPILQKHLDAHHALRLRVEQAEFMSRLSAGREQTAAHGSEPKPSPGQSFGPGM